MSMADTSAALETLAALRELRVESGPFFCAPAGARQLDA
jgi:hypothetical protein